MKRFRRVATTALTTTAMWVAHPAFAQVADPAGATPQTSANRTTAAAPDNAAQSEDIIVTATKVETRL